MECYGKSEEVIQPLPRRVSDGFPGEVTLDWGFEGEAVTHGHHCIGHILFIVLGGGHKGVYHIILKIFLNDFILKK